MTYDWHDDAACLGSPTAWFVPQGDGTTPRSQTIDGRAKQLCNTCPVAADCIAEGINEDERHMVRGGLLPWQLAMICARNGATGTPRGYHMHHRRHEPACPACYRAKLDANIAQQKQQRAARREVNQ
jgi:hypothetical protein